MLTRKEAIVLTALAQSGPQTSDQFVTKRGFYINSWAPSFTSLLKAGLVRRNGERRPTVHGATAAVIEITEAGRIALRSNTATAA